MKRMGNLRLEPDPMRHVFAAYRKGKRVGIVLYHDLVDGKKRLHRGRRARRSARNFRRTRGRFMAEHKGVISSSQPPHVLRWLGLEQP